MGRRGGRVRHGNRRMANFRLSAFSDEAGAALTAQIAALHRNGITLTELRGVDGENVSKLSDEKAKETARILAGEGIGLSAMGSPYGKYPIEQPFAEHLDAFRRGLELCNLLGTDRMRMFSFFYPKGGNADEWKNAVLDRLDEMLTLAKDAGVRLAHENEKGIYGDTETRCRVIKDAFGDRIDIVFDPANFVQCGVNTLTGLKLLGGDIAYAHIKDAMFADGSVVPAGKGEGHVDALIAALDARGGDYMLTLEPHLTVFDGLAGLQDEKVLHKYHYPTSDAAFDAAAAALKELLTASGHRETQTGIWAN